MVQEEEELVKSEEKDKDEKNEISFLMMMMDGPIPGA